MARFSIVTGRWSERPETEKALAERFARYLNEIAEIDPLFTRWLRSNKRHRSRVPQTITSPSLVSELRDWIGECSVYSSIGGRKTHSGYSVGAYTPWGERPYAFFSLRSNLVPRSNPYAGNGFCLVLDLLENAPPGDWRPARLILLALVEAWNVERARFACDPHIDPGDLGDEAPLTCKRGWLVYLGPQEADRSVDERNLRVETLSTGARLVNVPGDVF